LVSSVLAILLLLAAGVITSTAFALRAQRQKLEAQVQQKRAAEQAAVIGSLNAEADSAGKQAMYLAIQTKYDEAEPLYRHQLEIYRKTLPATHPSRVKAVHDLAFVLKKQGEWHYSREELLFAREAVDVDRQSLPAKDPRFLRDIRALAAILERKHSFGEAEGLYREVLEIARRSPVAEADRVTAQYDLATFLVAQYRPEEARPLLREAIDACRAESSLVRQGYSADRLHSLVAFLSRLDDLPQASPGDIWDIATRKRRLGAILIAELQYERAERLLLRAWSDGPVDAELINPIIGLYDAWGKSDSAASWRAKSPLTP
jgi:tetratricopeptide (TPR) repeat protein